MADAARAAAGAQRAGVDVKLATIRRRVVGWLWLLTWYAVVHVAYGWADSRTPHGGMWLSVGFAAMALAAQVALLKAAPKGRPQG